MDERYAPPVADEPARAASVLADARVFEYFVQPSGSRRAVGCLAVIVPGGVAALLGIVGLHRYALPAALLIGAWLWWRKRHELLRPQATLAIEGPLLRVLDYRLRELAHLPLKALLDVELDTKTIRRVEDNRNGAVLPQLSLFYAQVGSESDVSRIVLVTRDQEIPLTDEYLSSSYTTEAFGKMRQFLRSQGWLPKSERAASKNRKQ